MRSDEINLELQIDMANGSRSSAYNLSHFPIAVHTIPLSEGNPENYSLDSYKYDMEIEKRHPRETLAYFGAHAGRFPPSLDLAGKHRFRLGITSKR